MVSFWSERAQIGNSNPRLNIYTKPSAENPSGTRSRLILNVFVRPETSWQITGLNYLSKLSFPWRLMQNRNIDKVNERDRILFVQVATSYCNKKKKGTINRLILRSNKGVKYFCDIRSSLNVELIKKE